MSKQVHEFTVAMTCGGCSSAVEKVLARMKDKGVENVEISLQDQSVKVTADGLTSDQLLEAIKKTGKTTTYVGSKDL